MGVEDFLAAVERMQIRVCSAYASVCHLRMKSMLDYDESPKLRETTHALTEVLDAVHSILV